MNKTKFSQGITTNALLTVKQQPPFIFYIIFFFELILTRERNTIVSSSSTQIRNNFYFPFYVQSKIGTNVCINLLGLQ